MNEFGQFIPLIIIISIVWFLFARKKAKNLGQPKKVEEQSPTLRKNTSSNTKSPVYYIARGFGGYTEFNGRSNRSEFWWFYLFFLIISIITLMIDFFLFKSPDGFGPASIIFMLTFTIPLIAVTTRRLHDTGRSGWWQLITFTVIGVVPLLVWLASEGTQKNAIQNSKSQSDTATKLRELNQLHKEGIITKKEFSEAKKKYLK